MSMFNTSYCIKPRYCFFVFLLQYVNELLLSCISSPIYPDMLLINILNLVENIGVEPMTSCVQGRRSSQLS